MSASELSNISYTNKDFNSIYSELLDYAGKVSYKWDPRISDESDPGVVLLKLAAIIGDKDNYNIDKNLLELMPASVTQYPAARQIFEQCGYTMPYYNSAEGSLSITLVTDPEHELLEQVDDTNRLIYTIPQFTMFSDIDNEIVFTAKEKITLTTDERTAPVDIIQGSVKDYALGNDTLITLAHLDTRNRLYFMESDIAENGIFISNSGSFDDYSDWTRCEILELERRDVKCYRFGVDPNSMQCYLEFPDNISEFIKDGIYIKYIRTNGASGNIGAKQITQFFTEIKAECALSDSPEEKVSVDLTTSEVAISNAFPIINGTDPQSIDDAFRSYKRVKNTFKTLVSLQDYTDHMVTSKKASNGFVCDRTNDIQHTYRLLKQRDGVDLNSTKIEQRTCDNLYTKNESGDYVPYTAPAMTAFDLCIYGLKYQENVESADAFLKTFEIIPYGNGSEDKFGLENALTGYIYYLEHDALSEHVKCIQHDFNNVKHLPNRILMIKNKYPINANVIPQYKLSDTEYKEVIINISKSLYAELNSKKIDFGSPADYSRIYDTIMSADTRIRSLSLEYPEYQTYCVYCQMNEDTGKLEYKEMRIDMDSHDGGYSVKFPFTSSDTLYKLVGKTFEQVSYSVAMSNLKETYYVYNEDDSELWQNFRSEIFAKSVLGGTTPLYDHDTTFSYGVNQKGLELYSGISRVSTDTKLYFEIDQAFINTNPDPGSEEILSPFNVRMTRKLAKNENILLSAYNYINENQYSNYVKIIYDFPSIHKKQSDSIKLGKNNIYNFDRDDFIVFFWKQAEDDENYTYVKYDMSDTSLAKSISTSFNLPAKQPLPSKVLKDENADQVWAKIISHFKNLPASKVLSKTNGVSDMVAGVNFTETDFVSKLTSGAQYNVLTGTNTIYTKKDNTITITDEEVGSDQLFWILNADKHNAKGQAVLFDDITSDMLVGGVYQEEYTLRSGEYLFYTNPAKTALHMLGEGTLLRVTRKTKSAWVCDYLDYNTLLQYGPDLLNGLWFNVNSQDELQATEMQRILLGKDVTLTIENQDSWDPDDVTDISIENPDGIGSTKHYYCIVDSNKRTLSPRAVLKYSDGTNETTVNSVPDGWTIQSILNIDMSNEDPQIFNKSEVNTTPYYDQSIKLIKTEEESYTINNNMHLLSSQKLDKQGGANVDVTYKESGVTMTTDFMSYIAVTNDTSSDSEQGENYELTYPDETFMCNVHIHYPNNGNEVTPILKPFSLLPGKHLCKLTIVLQSESAQVNNLTLSYKYSDSDTWMYTPFFENGNNSVVTYYRIDNNTDVTKDVQLKLSTKGTGEVLIQVEELYRYTTTTLDSIPSRDGDRLSEYPETFEASLLNKLSEYDNDREFNYLHDVEDSLLISNPLISTTFNNKNHRYNQYMISQWSTNTDNSDAVIRILNNVR